MTSQQHKSAPTISISTLDNNRVSRTNMQKQQQQQQQQKPKPLLSFSTSNLNLKTAADNDNNDEDVRPILSNRISSPQTTQTQTSASPPACNIATNNNNINTSRNLMERMKERHRLEARRSLQPSPFLDNTQARTHNLSSPSMPIIFSATTAASPTATTTAAVLPIDNRPRQRSVVQSHSFTTYVKPTTPPTITASNQRSQQRGNLVRSASDINDIYNNASKPIQVIFPLI